MIRHLQRSVATAVVAMAGLGTSPFAPAVHLHVDRDGPRRGLLHQHAVLPDAHQPSTSFNHEGRGPGDDVEVRFVSPVRPAPLAVPGEPGRWAVDEVPPASPLVAPADRGDRPIHGPPRAVSRLRAPPPSTSLLF